MMVEGYVATDEVESLTIETVNKESKLFEEWIDAKLEVLRNFICISPNTCHDGVFAPLLIQSNWKFVCWSFSLKVGNWGNGPRIIWGAFAILSCQLAFAQNVQSLSKLQLFARGGGGVGGGDYPSMILVCKICGSSKLPPSSLSWCHHGCPHLLVSWQHQSVRSLIGAGQGAIFAPLQVGSKFTNKSSFFVFR